MCFHEPFCDPYHFGPESISDRYHEEGKAKRGVERSQSTYWGAFEKISKAAAEVIMHPGVWHGFGTNRALGPAGFHQGYGKEFHSA
jgi:hypothetical protein